MKKPWWQHEGAIAWALVVFFPLGLFMMWRYAPWRKRFKFLWTAAIPIVVLIIIGAAVGGTETEDSSEPAEAQATPADAVGTPTRTAAELAYIEAVTTQQAEKASLATAAAEETEAARPTNTPAPTRTPVPTRTPKPPPYKLALISAACNRQYDYIVCEGFVENISGKSMESIEAVALFFDDTGTPITSDSALIDYDPILPGQQSPFSIYARYNPAISKWRIEFKEFFGGTILTRDDHQ
jgi:hypothetical protein